MSDRPRCPHCNSLLRRWATPVTSTWDTPFLYVCLNDDCEYFVRGWAWMEEHYGVRSSYRFHMDPTTGASGPLPVYSRDLIKNEVLPDPPDETEHDGTGSPEE